MGYNLYNKLISNNFDKKLKAKILKAINNHIAPTIIYYVMMYYNGTVVYHCHISFALPTEY